MERFQFRDQKQRLIFFFLDGLRESGAVNMFGATPYLMKAFALEEAEAKEYLKEWMSTFSKRVGEK